MQNLLKPTAFVSFLYDNHSLKQGNFCYVYEV